MILVTVKSSYAPQDMEKAISTLAETKDRAKQMPGCLSYELYTDPVQSDLVFLIQGWADQTTFDAYRNSGVFADMAVAIKPLMTAPPETLMYQAEPAT